MKRSDSILQNYYMSKLPKYQERPGTVDEDAVRAYMMGLPGRAPKQVPKSVPKGLTQISAQDQFYQNQLQKYGRTKEDIERSRQEAALPFLLATGAIGAVAAAPLLATAGPAIAAGLSYAPIASAPAATLGNLLSSGFASDFLLNRAPQIPGQIARDQYGDALANTAFGALDLMGVGAINPNVINNAGRLVNQGRQYLGNTYRNIAEGDNIFNYAWRSPAAGITDDIASRMHQQTRNSLPLDESTKDIIAEYQHTSGPFTGRFESGNINYAKRIDLEDAIAQRNLVTESGKPNVLIRRFDPNNPELYSLNKSGQFILNRPTSWSVGRGWNYTSKPDRVVFKLPSGSRGLLNEYNTSKFNQDVSKLIDEREAIMGSGLNLGKRLGKVKNEFGGYDYIHKFQGYNPTEYDDIRRLNTENIGEIVDLTKNLATSGGFNKGVYPFFRNPNIVLKLGTMGESGMVSPNNNLFTGIPEIARDMSPSMWGINKFPAKEIDLSGLTAKQIGQNTSKPIPNNILGSVMERTNAKNLSDVSFDELANLEPWVYRNAAQNVNELIRKGVAIDFYGNNMLLDKFENAVPRFSFIDLGTLPKNNAGVFPVGPLYALDSKALDQGVRKLDLEALKSIFKQKTRNALYDAVAKSGIGSYSDQQIFDAIKKSEASIDEGLSLKKLLSLNNKQKGGPISAQDGQEMTYTWDPMGSAGDQYMLKRTVTPYTSKRDIRRFTQLPTDPSQVNFISNYGAAIGDPSSEGFNYPTSVPYEGEKHWNIDRFLIQPAFGNLSSDLQNKESTRKQMKNNVLADMYKYFMIQNKGDKKDAWKQAKQFVRKEINPRIRGSFYDAYLRGNDMPLTGLGLGITSAIPNTYMYNVNQMMEDAGTELADFAARRYAENPVPKSKYKKFGMDWLMNYKGLSRKEAKDYLKKSETLQDGGPMVNPRGFMDGQPPIGSNWRIPGNILYNPTPYKIRAVGSNGVEKTLKPFDTKRVSFGDAEYVDEYMLQKGGTAKKSRTHYIFAESPGYKPGSDLREAAKDNSFIKEALDMQSYLNKNYPDEKVVIVPGYESSDNPYTKKIKETLKESTPEDYIYLYGHHGSRYAGIPATEWGDYFRNAKYANCFLGSCSTDDLVTQQYKNVENLYVRDFDETKAPNYNTPFGRLHNFYYRPAESWWGVNPNAPKGKDLLEGVLSAMYTTKNINRDPVLERNLINLTNTRDEVFHKYIAAYSSDPEHTKLREEQAELFRESSKASDPKVSRKLKDEVNLIFKKLKSIEDKYAIKTGYSQLTNEIERNMNKLMTSPFISNKLIPGEHYRKHDYNMLFDFERIRPLVQRPPMLLGQAGSFKYGGSLSKHQIGGSPATSLSKSGFTPSLQVKTIKTEDKSLSNFEQTFDKLYGEYNRNFLYERLKNDRKGFYSVDSKLEKRIPLTTGRFKGANVRETILKEAINAAKQYNVDPWLIVSMMGRESTFGEGTEQNKDRAGNYEGLMSGWTLAEDFQPYDPLRYLADRRAPGIKVIKTPHGWNYHVNDETRLDDYLKKNTNLFQKYADKLKKTPKLGNLNSVQLAARFLKTHKVGDYNPGDPNYTRMVYDDMKILKSDPEMSKFMKSLGYKMGGLTANKAREILHHGEVGGRKLTDKQRRFFGAMSKGNTKKY